MVRTRRALTWLGVATFTTAEITLLGLWVHDLFIGWMRSFPWLH
jgi:hypothetical protein